MWLLLEYDQVLQEQAYDQLSANGIQVEVIRREDQLQHVKRADIELVVVGTGWKSATVELLNTHELGAKLIYAVSELTPSTHEEAKQLGCQDVVMYPLSIQYLKQWARSAQKAESIIETTTTQSPMERILARKGVSTKSTYTDGKARSTEVLVPSMLRGRIITTYGIRGGIGKSTMTALLSSQLASRNYTVALVDLSPKGIQLNLHRLQATLTVDDWTKMPQNMDERMVRSSLVQSKTSGFWILPSGPKTAQIDPVSVKRILYNIAQYFDFVLVDTVDEHEGTKAALDVAHRVVYVLHPDWVGLKQSIDGYQDIRALKGDEAVTVAVNMIRKKEHKFTLRVLDEADIPSPEVDVYYDSVLYKELQNAKPMVGSAELQTSIQDVSDALGFDPVMEELKPKKKWGLFR